MEMKDSPIALAEYKKRLSKLEKNLLEAKKERNDYELTETTVQEYTQIYLYFVEHMGEFLIDNSNPMSQKALFQIVFEELPTYDDIINRTAKITSVFRLLKESEQQKVPMAALRGFEPLFPP